MSPHDQDGTMTPRIFPLFAQLRLMNFDPQANDIRSLHREWLF